MTHTHLVRAIQQALGALPGVLVLSNNQGTAQFVNANTGRSYTVAYGLGGAGAPDLVLFLGPDGRALGLECKTGSGRPSPDQIKVHRVWADFGVPVHVVRSVDEALAALHARRAA